MPQETRPELAPGMAAGEFGRWYWSKAELTTFARRLGLRPSGSKDALQHRIASSLAGGRPPRRRPAGAARRLAAVPLHPGRPAGPSLIFRG